MQRFFFLNPTWKHWVSELIDLITRAWDKKIVKGSFGFHHLGLESKNLFIILIITCLAAMKLVMEFIWHSVIFHLIPNLNTQWVHIILFYFYQTKRNDGYHTSPKRLLPSIRCWSQLASSFLLDTGWFCHMLAWKEWYVHGYLNVPPWYTTTSWCHECRAIKLFS
jgi:hypothetical protein